MDYQEIPSSSQLLSCTIRAVENEANLNISVNEITLIILTNVSTGCTYEYFFLILSVINLTRRYAGRWKGIWIINLTKWIYFH